MKRVIKNPFVFGVLALTGALLLMGLASSLAQNASPDRQRTVHAILEILLLGLYVLAVKKFLGPGFDLGIRTARLGSGLKMLVSFFPAVLVNLYGFLQAAVTLSPAVTGAEIPAALLPALLQGIRPGITEELVFRVLLMGSFLHLAAGRPWRIWGAAVFSSAIFGLMHLNNLSTGQPLDTTLIQVMYSFSIGMLFAAVYARTRNILPAMLLHAMVDTVVSLKMALFVFPPQEGGASEGILLYVLLSLLWLGSGLYLLRGSRHPQILALWGPAAPCPEVPQEAM